MRPSGMFRLKHPPNVLGFLIRIEAVPDYVGMRAAPVGRNAKTREARVPAWPDARFFPLAIPADDITLNLELELEP